MSVTLVSVFLCTFAIENGDDAHALQSASKFALLSLNRIIAADLNHQRRMKAIVIYFSWDGLVERMAREVLSRIPDADEFRIVPVKEYPNEKMTLCARVSQELFDGARPEYVGDVDITEYDTVVFGCPIWAHQLPPVVSTFIGRHNFAGKTVWPFCSCLTKLDAPKASEIGSACKGCIAQEGFAVVDEPTGLEEWINN